GRTAAVLQFLNRNVKVTVETDANAVPENCFIVTRKESGFIPAREVEIDELGSTGEYVVYAYGERAVMYANSQKE
ncbi:MAG: hypothetical protein LBI36_01740, partial [Oscillospiraceae bacterium]|nr:hypothetical protein [Oscillospiraceae bacterium]